MSNSDGQTATSRTIQGIGVSPGIAVATAVLYRSRVYNAPAVEIAPSAIEHEWRRLAVASEVTRRQLKVIRARVDEIASSGEAGIIDGHMMVLDDEIITADLHHEIFDLHHNAEWAVREVANKYIAQFQESGDALFRERADDLSDVARRLLRNLMGVKEELPGAWDRPCVVVAENLTPSETLALPRSVVKAVVLDRGSLTSHAALLMRAIGIPAVVGLGTVSQEAVSGQQIAVDGGNGVVVLNPGRRELSHLLGLARMRESIVESLRERRGGEAVTPDGVRVRVMANVESAAGVSSLVDDGAEGIGLFRTEYLWMASGKPVPEDDQVAAYRAAFDAMGDRPVIIRAFDLGGDKFAGETGLCESEENPFLGLRSLRYLLHDEDVLRMQLRAIMRASAGGAPANILLPMVADISELVRTREIMEECLNDLAENGVECKTPRLGIMVEVPSAALTAQFLAKRADFFSVGSNDLTQYTMAADRTNELVAHLYQPAHPSVLRLVKMAADAAKSASIPLGLCGEMASVPGLAAILVGMGFDSLSMAPTSIPAIKALIRAVPFSAAKALADAALSSGSAATVLELSRDFLARHVPDLLSL